MTFDGEIGISPRVRLGILTQLKEALLRPSALVRAGCL